MCFLLFFLFVRYSFFGIIEAKTKLLLMLQDCIMHVICRERFITANVLSPRVRGGDDWKSE